MIGLLGRIAGPKVLLGVLIAAGLTIGWLWWSYSDAAADAAQASANADEALAAAEQNREAAQQWKRNAEAIARTLEQRQEREHALEAKVARQQQELQDAREQASQAVRDCLDTRLPPDYLDGLRAQPRGGDGDQGGEG